MTPPAATAAARGRKATTAAGRRAQQQDATPDRLTVTQSAPAATRPRRAASPRGPKVGGHRATVRKPSLPRIPRRVSGPAGGKIAAAATGVAAGVAAPLAPRVRPERAAPAGDKASRSLRARAEALVRGLPDHPLLDRLIRGRMWIPVLGVLLVGIVAMQVEVLKLGASIGRSLEQSATLETRNQLLRTSVTQLADDQRIEQLAAGYGMVMPPVASVGFLAASPAPSLQQVFAGIHAPDSATFDSLTTSNGSAVTPAAINADQVVPGQGDAGTGMAADAATQTATGPSTAATTGNSSATATTGNSGAAAAATGNSGTSAATTGNSGVTTATAGNSGTSSSGGAATGGA